MGINLEASRAKMEAQLEVELSKIQDENRRLKAECEQKVQDAQHSEKRESVPLNVPTGGIHVMGSQMGIAMTDQDIASAFVKRRLPTKVARPA
eukprot:2816408-Amphidinium_carterae.1